MGNRKQKLPELTERDEETGATIRSFLASVRPLRGCCHCDDDQFHRGRALVELLALSAEDHLAPPLSSADYANILRFIHGIEPIEPKYFFVDRDGVRTPQCGLNTLLEIVEQHLRRAAGSAVGKAVRS